MGLANAYKYVSEAWGGYHWDVAHGLNVDAGIFVSYIGLFSYYNFETGPISLPSFLPTRHGFSTAFAFSISRQQN